MQSKTQNCSHVSKTERADVPMRAKQMSQDADNPVQKHKDVSYQADGTIREKDENPNPAVGISSTK